MISIVTFSFVLSSSAADPVNDFLKSNPDAELKTDYTEGVEKLLGPKINPSKVRGDFNCDGKPDQVILVSKGTKDFMVFFTSNSSGFSKSLKKIPKSDITYLSTVAKDQIKSGLPKGQKCDLVQLETFYGPTKAFFVQGGKAVEFKGVLSF